MAHEFPSPCDPQYEQKRRERAPEYIAEQLSLAEAADPRLAVHFLTCAFLEAYANFKGLDFNEQTVGLFAAVARLKPSQIAEFCSRCAKEEDAWRTVLAYIACGLKDLGH